MKAEAQKEHEWLRTLIGEWTCEGEASMGPGDPVMKWTNTETVRSLEGLWAVAESRTEDAQGGVSTTLMTIGYDPAKRRYVGTFVGSMMTNLWVYEGTVDDSGRVLTLDTEGPVHGVEGKTAKYKDILEIKNNDERTLTSKMLGDDGQWIEVMSATYRRQK